MEYQEVVKKVVEEIKSDFSLMPLEDLIKMIWDEAKYENLHHPVRWKGRVLLEKTVRELVHREQHCKKNK